MNIKDRTIHADGVELVTQAFGDANDRPLLLIMGAMASMLWWPEALCEKLAAAGHYVIRYDNRDTGLSTTSKPGKPDYSFDDMADDGIRVLDGYGLKSAHLAGMSMGGMLAQRVALARPDRVATLTAISTSPVGVDTSGLPGMTDAYKAHVAEGEKVDFADRDQFIAFVVKDVRAIAGTAFPHDAEAARSLIERDVARARNFVSATNHFVLAGGGEDVDIRELTAPLLVIHGTADPIFPVEHGEALAGAVKVARIVKLEGGGHEMHPGHWDRIVSEISKHTANQE